MKKIIFFVVILIKANSALSQRSAEDVLNEGRNAIKKGQYEIALADFKYILEKQPQYNDIVELSYFLGVAYCGVGQFENEGKEVFERLLDLNDSNHSGYVANIKHSTAIQLYKNFKEKKVYDSALKWLYFADTTYPHWPVCGTDYESNMSEAEENFLEIFRISNRHSELKWLLLRTALIHYNTDTNKILELRQLFITYENAAALRQEFDTAIKHWATLIDTHSSKIPSFNGKGFEERIFDGYRYISFQGINMYIDKYKPSPQSKSSMKKESLEFTNKIKTTAFYKMLHSL